VRAPGAMANGGPPPAENLPAAPGPGMDIHVQGIEHWIEASMADLARGLGDRAPAWGADREVGRELALDVELALPPAWMTEDVWPAEPVWAPDPGWHTDVEDGQVVTSTDDVVQLDRSNRLAAVRLDIA